MIIFIFPKKQGAVYFRRSASNMQKMIYMMPYMVMVVPHSINEPFEAMGQRITE
jgi:hypothetical protein